MLRFTAADLERANAEWSCSCGPAALAAISDLTLDEVRPHFPKFTGWTNPTMMIEAIKRARPHARFMCSTYRDHGWPRYGIARIQFEGPWLKPGVNPRAAYRYTHWVGSQLLSEQVSSSGVRDIAVWDINALQEPSDDGWLELDVWSNSIVPAIMPKRGTGWHITHAIEVSR